MPSRTLNIIKALYGNEVNDAGRRNGLLRPGNGKTGTALAKRNGTIDLFGEEQTWLSRRNVILAALAGLFVFHLYLCVYYYNQLTSTQQDVAAEYAKIESLLDRRRNTSVNLARTLIDYAAHEKDLFHHVSNMRAYFSGKEPPADSEDPALAADPHAAGATADPAPGAGSKGASPPLQAGKAPNLPGGLKQVLDYLNASAAGEPTGVNGVSGLLAFAEQYPDLKLSGNFQRFMDALVEVEKDISAERIKCADLVNTYTTRRMTFPGNVFAAMYGFDEIPYYQADPEAKKFKPVEY
jgi:LemA protein